MKRKDAERAAEDADDAVVAVSLAASASMPRSGLWCVRSSPWRGRPTHGTGALIMTTIETPPVIRNLWKSVLSLGVLSLIVGAAVLVWPGQSIVAAGILFVVYLLASGPAGHCRVYGPFAGRQPCPAVHQRRTVDPGRVRLPRLQRRRHRMAAGLVDGSGSHSEVSARPYWRSASRNCPNAAGTSSWES